MDWLLSRRARAAHVARALTVGLLLAVGVLAAITSAAAAATTTRYVYDVGRTVAISSSAADPPQKAAVARPKSERRGYDKSSNVAPQTPTGGGVSPVDLYATGNASGPKVRPSDLGVDGPEDDVCLGESESGLLWGASTFARESDLQTRGKIWMLPAGSVVPPDLAVIPDGADYGGVAPTSHHSIVATRSMPFAQFEALYRGLGWINTGRIR